MKRILVASIAGGTATQTLTVPATGTIREVVFSGVTAAAGSWEFSKSSTSQIATAVPDAGVLCRTRIGATAGGNFYNKFELNVPVKTLDFLYIHCTGAGNVGEVTVRID